MAEKNGLACFFKNQVAHWALLLVLLGITWAVRSQMEAGDSGFLGLSVRFWFLLSLGVPILHQVFIWGVWRAELCYSAVTGTFGTKGFECYAILFSILGISRVLAVLGLGIADFQSLGPAPRPHGRALGPAHAAGGVPGFFRREILRGSAGVRDRPLRRGLSKQTAREAGDLQIHPKRHVLVRIPHLLGHGDRLQFPLGPSAGIFQPRLHLGPLSLYGEARSANPLRQSPNRFQ